MRARAMVLSLGVIALSTQSGGGGGGDVVPNTLQT